MNFYKRHLGDIAKACGHLSQGQQGAYDLLLDWLYGNEKPIPKNMEAVYRIGRAVTKPERDNVDQMLEEFFTLTDAGFVQKRASLEIAKANAQAETNRRIAEEREAKRRGGFVDDSYNGSSDDSLNGSCTNREPSQTPDTRHQKEQEQKLPPDGGGEVGRPTTPPADLGKRQQERLRQVTDEARLAFNAALGKPVGLLPSVRLLTPDRMNQVKRCLTVARAICQAQYGAQLVTPQFWADYFAVAAADDFHAGRQAGGPGHENWAPDFEYLTRPAVMSKLFDRAMADEPLPAAGALL